MKSKKIISIIMKFDMYAYFTGNNVPSTDTTNYWIMSNVEFKPDAMIVGKWLIFCNRTKKDKDKLTELDRVWKTIFDTHKYDAKTSTAVDMSTSSDNTKGVICVYTSEEDIHKVSEELDKLLPNINKQICYKYDTQTRSREYAVNGDTQICKYKKNIGTIVIPANVDYRKSNEIDCNIIPYGKHKGTKFEDAPPNYLNWIKSLKTGMFYKAYMRYLDQQEKYSKEDYFKNKIE